MGKNDILTPRVIANRIKAKGLKKLPWYCRMCQKQCRDENGFKRHFMSESHQLQMAKGWFINYVDRDSETVFKSKMKDKRVGADLVDEEKKEREILRQIERAEQVAVVGGEEKAVEPEEMSEKAAELPSGKVAFALGGGGVVVNEGKGVVGVFQDDLMVEDEKVNRKDYWLCEGIVVKTMCIKLKEKGDYKMKGVVRKVIDKYVAEIEMVDSKHVLRVDQADLETVIPQIGGRVRIVNGDYRGSNAKLLAINKFCAKVQIEKGVCDGRVIPAVDYEDICKIA